MSTTGSYDGDDRVFIDVRCATDVGLVRDRNEDVQLAIELATGASIAGGGPVCVGERGVLLAVFDGMGGAASGDVAARVAAETIAARVPVAAASDLRLLGEALWRGVYDANDAVLRAARKDPRCLGMGTTIIGAAILGRHVTLVHVGDSRAYLVRAGALHQLTTDQSLQNELAAQAVPSAEGAGGAVEYSNIILQAVGVGQEMEPFVATAELRRGDLLLLCSDGLTDAVSAEELLQTLQQPAGDLAARAAALIALANAAGGHDNTTVIVAALSGAGLSAEDSAPVEVIPLSATRLRAQRRRRRAVRAAAVAGAAVLLALGIAALVAVLGGAG